MRKFTGLALGFVAVGLGVGSALANEAESFANASPWGRYFSVAPAGTHKVDLMVATNKQTGSKINLIQLPNGHIMALVPADGYMAMTSGTPEQDMMR